MELYRRGASQAGKGQMPAHMAGGVDRFDLQPAKCQNLPIGQPMVGGISMETLIFAGLIKRLIDSLRLPAMVPPPRRRRPQPSPTTAA